MLCRLSQAETSRAFEALRVGKVGVAGKGTCPPSFSPRSSHLSISFAKTAGVPTRMRQGGTATPPGLPEGPCPGGASGYAGDSTPRRYDGPPQSGTSAQSGAESGALCPGAESINQSVTSRLSPSDFFKTSSVRRTRKGVRPTWMRVWRAPRLRKAAAPPKERTLSLVSANSPTLPSPPCVCCPPAPEPSGREPPRPPPRGEAGHLWMSGGRSWAAGPKGTPHAALCPGLADAEGHQPWWAVFWFLEDPYPRVTHLQFP